MPHPRFLFSLAASFGVTGASAPSFEAQAPLAAVVAVGEDSVGLVLSRRSYVVVAEVRPHHRPRILFPQIDDDWKPRAAGAADLELARSLRGSLRAPDLALIHCLVGPTTLAQWSSAEGLRSGGTRAACGPLPTSKGYAGGTGPWEAWATPHYDTGPTSEYLVIVAFDGTTRAVGPNAVASALSPDQSPVAVARMLGSLSGRPNDSGAWQASIVRLR